MSARLLAGIAVIATGGVLQAPIVSLLGVVLFALEGVHLAWRRRGVGSVSHERQLALRRIPFGGWIPLSVEVWNRSRLPLAWLRADDETSPGVIIREREQVGADPEADGVFPNAWTLRPYERVRRQFHVGADRRGAFTVGPATITVGDPFGREAAAEDRPGAAGFLVWPRIVPTTEVAARDRSGTLLRAHAGLVEDTSRFNGVRPYVPGDPLRRLHARTSARLGQPMLKRFEPSRDREVLIAIDVQTDDGPAWASGFGDHEVIESLYVTAASLARALAERRVAFGLCAAGFTGAESLLATVPISAAPGQLERALDLLARLSTHASAPFGQLLASATRQVAPGTSVLVLTARDPRPFAASFRRLRRMGADVTVIAVGAAADGSAHGVRGAGVAVRHAHLDGPWRTAEQLVVTP